MSGTYVNAEKLLAYLDGAARFCHTPEQLLRELTYYLKHLPADAKLEKENTTREKN